MGARRVEGKVAMITGGSRGIGREIVLTLAREGAAVGVSHFPDQAETGRARTLVDELSALEARAIALPADVTDAAAMREAGRRLVETLGRVDIVVTNAGVIDRRPFVDVTEADWSRVIDVNLTGTFNAIQAVLPYLLRQGHGKIVTVASELALIGRAGAAAYAASKAGVIGLTKSLARELSPLGIHVNAVAPGPVDTDMLRSNPEFRYENRLNVPLRRWGNPRDIALTVLFLASADSDFYAGQVLSPNGGVVM